MAWRRCVVGVALAVGAYGVVLVVAGGVAGHLFDLFGFGMGSGVPPGPRAYIVFTYRVLGAVITGWMVLVARVATGPLAEGRAWATSALAWSLGSWFVLDTGMSLVVGSWQHAVFNLVFALGLGVPLAALRPSRLRR